MIDYRTERDFILKININLPRHKKFIDIFLGRLDYKRKCRPIVLLIYSHRRIILCRCL